jgi:hypothetical protein
MPSLVKEREDATGSLEHILHKMVAKRPQERYQTMEEVLAALEPHRPTHGSGAATLGMGSSIGMGPSRHDAELASYVKTMGPKPAATPTVTGTPVKTIDVDSATEMLGNRPLRSIGAPEPTSTQPRSTTATPTVTPAVTRSDSNVAGSTPKKTLPKKMIAIAAGVAIVVVVVVVVLLTRGG